MNVDLSIESMNLDIHVLSFFENNKWDKNIVKSL